MKAVASLGSCVVVVAVLLVARPHRVIKAPEVAKVPEVVEPAPHVENIDVHWGPPVPIDPPDSPAIYREEEEHGEHIRRYSEHRDGSVIHRLDRPEDLPQDQQAPKPSP